MMGGSLFRSEASAGLSNTDTRGTVLSIAPPAAITIFAIVTGLLIAGAFFVSCGHVNVYAEGRGVITPSEDPTYLRAPFSSVVLSVDQRAGYHGKAGDIVVTLELPPETRSLSECNELVRAAKERIETGERQIATLEDAKNKDNSLLATLLEGQMTSERSRLASTEQRCKQIEALTAEARVHFTGAGVLAETRVIPGQRVQAGEILAAVLPETSRLVAHVSVEEEHRADVEVNKPVRLRFDACAYQEHGVGEGRVARLLEVADEARLPHDADGKPHAGFVAEVDISKLPSGYCSTIKPGMALTGTIFVREQSVAALLFPTVGQ
jgi:multidrug efflux pump subunit AcrA (membrane-fusion protein)